MILLIDIGNTRTKWALQTQLTQLGEVFSAPTQMLPNTELTHAFSQAKSIWVSSVVGKDAPKFLREPLIATQEINWVQPSAMMCGLQCTYQPIASLGVDRWCGLLASWQQQQSALVVSLGTAVTIDALKKVSTERARFLGGSIQPGLYLMLQSLSQGTRLPELTNLTEALSLQSNHKFALNTQAAMMQGCISAVIGAIEQQYQKLAQQTQSFPLLIMTGGDAALIKTNLPKSLAKQAVFVDNLVLAGLMILAGKK